MADGRIVYFTFTSAFHSVWCNHLQLMAQFCAFEQYNMSESCKLLEIILCQTTYVLYIIKDKNGTYVLTWGSISCVVCLHASTRERRNFRTFSRNSGQSRDCPMCISKSRNSATWLLISTISWKADDNDNNMKRKEREKKLHCVSQEMVKAFLVPTYMHIRAVDTRVINFCDLLYCGRVCLV